MLQIYNTMTKEKEPFKPIVPGKVSFYVCGVTVYDYCHIGHGRTYIAFDVILRYLKFRGYEINYVRNITDIDDKIIKRAEENNETTEALTTRFIKAMHEDFKALGLMCPQQEPKATEFMSQMLALITRLQDQGFAYQADNGDVYFEVNQFKGYGKLSRRQLDDMISGARVEVNTAKRDPKDFVLWKQAKPGEPSWPSPWGEGRPGWHLECSAMSMDLLGETFDIHGGGFDLTFPHHENECAQSEAASGKQFVNTWMHCGFLQIDKEKMSKSLGNFATIRQVLETTHPEVLRYFMITSHYRSALEYSPEQVESARGTLEKFYLGMRGVPVKEAVRDSEYEQKFIAAMDDDFNTPEALAVLFELLREINRTKETNVEEAAPLVGLLKELAGLLGILQCDSEQFLKELTPGNADGAEKIESLIIAREEARKAKQWQEADRLRDELDNLGVVLEDTVSGTTWRRK